MTAKFTALAWLAANYQLCVVARQYVFDDSQTQAGTAILSTTAPVHTIEALGESWEMLRVDSLTGVRDDEVGAVSIGTPGQHNLAVRRREANGI